MLETQEIWTDILEDKDKLSIRELAAKYVVPVGAIVDAFQRTGTKRQAVLPPAAMALSEGREKPRRAKKKTGRRGARSKDAVLEPFAEQMGARPDSEIAAEAGVNPRTVANFRSKRGIAAFTGKRTTRRRRSRVEPYRHLLGKVPDREVAEKAGVSLNTVRNFRVAEGIKPLGRSGAAKLARQKGTVTAAPAPAPAPPAASPRASSGGAWRLLLSIGGREEVRVVVGTDIVAAAERARGAAAGLGADIRSLSYIGALV